MYILNILQFCQLHLNTFKKKLKVKYQRFTPILRNDKTIKEIITFEEQIKVLGIFYIMECIIYIFMCMIYDKN